MKRIKQLSIWMIALLAITVTNPAWAWGDYDEPTGGSYEAGYPKAVGTTPVELKWTKGNENVTPQNRLRYWVDWKKKSGEGAGKSAPMIDITTYTLTGLEPIFEFMIDLEDPTPGKYGTVTTTLTTATINWTKATDNKTKQNKLRYQVFWYKAIGGPITRTEWMTDITTYTITGLEPNTEYILEVEVRDESVNYISYGKRWFKTKAPVDKKDPTPGTYEAGYPKAVGSTSIEVRWTKGIDDVTPQDRLMYWVYWYTESGERLGKTATMIDITTYTITGLEPSTKYKVVVLVGDEVGRYNTYGGRTVKTQAVPDYDRPTAGSYGTITATANSITVNWTRGTDDITPQNKLRYKVVWKEKSSTMFGNGSILYTDMTSYTLTDLKPNTEYILEVQVWDEANNYKFYGERTVKTKADTQDPTWGSWGTNTSTATTITLNWTKATDNATPQKKLRYQVLWKKKSATSWNYTGLKKNITTHTLTGLDPDTEYDVNVEVRDETDHTAYYGYITVKTKVLDTEKPKAGCNGKITIGTVTANSIALSWCAATDNVTPKDKLRYQVAWKKKSSTSWAWTFFSTNITTYTLTGLDPDTEYQVDVLVYDEVENRSYYGVREVKTKAAGGGSSDTQRPTPGSYEAGYPKAVGATSIELKWTRGRDNKTAQADLQYVVYWKKSSESAWQASHSGPATNFPKDWTAYTITGLQPNTEYIMIVLVQDEAGNYTDYRPRTVKTQAAGATIAVTGVTLTPASLSLEVGQTGGLTATVAPATATNKKVTWTSSNTAVATVDGSGTVKGIAPGTATITVKTVDGGKTATAAVTVKAATVPTVKVSDVTLNRNTFTVNGDYEEVQLTATVAPSNATDKSLTWSSDNPQVASVDANGLVTIHKKGKARVTARANDGSGRYDACDFNVIMTVGNETVDGLRVYAAGSALYLTLPTAETVHIYNVHGAMVKTLFLSAGDHVEPLPSGVYLVRVGERVTKILVK